MNDLFWMHKAHQLAILAKKVGEVPIGAVLVSKDNQLLGAGYNQVIHSHDASAHAEMIAIRQAGIKLKNYRLPNTTLYVTLEPCIMCAGAMVHARIQRLVFACRDFKVGAAGSVYNVLRGDPQNHVIMIDEGILQKECADLLEDFFKKRR